MAGWLISQWPLACFVLFWAPYKELGPIQLGGLVGTCCVTLYITRAQFGCVLRTCWIPLYHWVTMLLSGWYLFGHLSVSSRDSVAVFGPCWAPLYRHDTVWFCLGLVTCTSLYHHDTVWLCLGLVEHLSVSSRDSVAVFWGLLGTSVSSWHSMAVFGTCWAPLCINMIQGGCLGLVGYLSILMTQCGYGWHLLGTSLYHQITLWYGLTCCAHPCIIMKQGGCLGLVGHLSVSSWHSVAVIGTCLVPLCIIRSYCSMVGLVGHLPVSTVWLNLGFVGCLCIIRLCHNVVVWLGFVGCLCIIRWCHNVVVWLGLVGCLCIIRPYTC